MKAKNQIAKWMIIISLCVSVASLTVCILAVSIGQYFIAGVMALLTLFQVWNCRVWQKRA